MSNFILVVLAIATFLAAEGVYYLILSRGQEQRQELKRRLRTLAQVDSAGLLKDQRIADNPSIANFLRPIPFTHSLERMLNQTDMSWTVATMLGISIGGAVFFCLFLLLLFKTSPVMAMVGLPIGGSIPFLLVMSNRSKRSAALSTQLPDALDMMVRSLRAGNGITAGFRLVAEEMPPPVAVEFGRCFEEQNLGVDFRDAVKNMTARVPGNLDLKIMAVSVVIQRETGGNLVEILDQIGATVRERYKFYGKLKALTAEGRISGIILGALPFFTASAVLVMSPGYLMPLVTDPLGRMMLLAGVSLWGAGLFWMKMLSKVDF